MQWQDFREHSFIRDGDVHVWRMSLEINEAQRTVLFDLLNDTEQDRALRFRFEKHRKRFIAAHGQLRIVLGRYLQCHPNDLHFEHNQHGKPLLPGRELHFNISHSNELALMAFSRDYELGVDVEWHRPGFAGIKIARRFFSSLEVEELENLSAAAQEKAFFDCWSRKEAYIKARGKGLAIPLGQFTVSVSGSEPVLISTEHDPAALNRWVLRSLQPGEDYSGAIVVRKGNWRIKTWEGSDIADQWA